MSLGVTDKILIVEDEIDLSESISQLLASYLGIECIIAKNGHDALEKMADVVPEIALVLCDISMPIMNGIELYKVVLQKYGYIPFVMLTAHSESVFITQALRLGAIDYFIKPMISPLFIEQIPIWIEIGRRHKEFYKSENDQFSRMELLLRLKSSMLVKN